MKNLLLRNTFFSGIETIASRIINFLVLGYMIVKLKENYYGIYSLSLIFSTKGYLSLIELGISGAAIKYIAQYKEEGDNTKLYSIFLIITIYYLIISIISTILLLIFTKNYLLSVFHIPVGYQKTAVTFFYMISFQVSLQFISFIFTSILSGLQRFDLFKSISLAYSILDNLLIVLVLKSGYTLLTIGLTGIFTLIIYNIFLFLATKKIIKIFIIKKIKIEFYLIKDMFSLGIKFFISKIIGLIFNQTDKIIIGVALTTKILTEYDIVAKPHQLIFVLSSILNSAIIPYTSALQAKKKYQVLQNLFLYGTKYTVILLLPIIILFIIIMPSFISIWTNAQYTYLSKLAIFYMSHLFFSILTGIGSTMLAGLNKMKVPLIISSIGAIINLIISIIFVKYYGLLGIIIGTIIGYIVIFIPYILYIKHILNFTFQDIYKIIIEKNYSISIITGIIFYIIYINSCINNWITLLIFSLIYIVFNYTLLFFFSLSKEEKKYFIGVLGNVYKYFINKPTI